MTSSTDSSAPLERPLQRLRQLQPDGLLSLGADHEGPRARDALRRLGRELSRDAEAVPVADDHLDRAAAANSPTCQTHPDKRPGAEGGCCHGVSSARLRGAAGHVRGGHRAAIAAPRRGGVRAAARPRDVRAIARPGVGKPAGRAVQPGGEQVRRPGPGRAAERGADLGCARYLRRAGRARCLEQHRRAGPAERRPGRVQVAAAASVQVGERDPVADLVGPVDPPRRRVDGHADRHVHRCAGRVEVATAAAVQVCVGDRRCVDVGPVDPSRHRVKGHTVRVRHSRACGVEIRAAGAIEVGEGDDVGRVAVGPVDPSGTGIDHRRDGNAHRRAGDRQIAAAGVVEIRVREPVAQLVGPVDLPRRRVDRRRVRAVDRGPGGVEGPTTPTSVEVGESDQVGSPVRPVDLSRSYVHRHSAWLAARGAGGTEIATSAAIDIGPGNFVRGALVHPVHPVGGSGGGGKRREQQESREDRQGSDPMAPAAGVQAKRSQASGRLSFAGCVYDRRGR